MPLSINTPTKRRIDENPLAATGIVSWDPIEAKGLRRDVNV